MSATATDATWRRDGHERSRSAVTVVTSSGAKPRLMTVAMLTLAVTIAAK